MKTIEILSKAKHTNADCPSKEYSLNFKSLAPTQLYWACLNILLRSYIFILMVASLLYPGCHGLLYIYIHLLKSFTFTSVYSLDIFHRSVTFQYFIHDKFFPFQVRFFCHSSASMCAQSEVNYLTLQLSFSSLFIVVFVYSPGIFKLMLFFYIIIISCHLGSMIFQICSQ